MKLFVAQGSRYPCKDLSWASSPVCELFVSQLLNGHVCLISPCCFLILLVFDDEVGQLEFLSRLLSYTFACVNTV